MPPAPWTKTGGRPQRAQEMCSNHSFQAGILKQLELLCLQCQSLCGNQLSIKKRSSPGSRVSLSGHWILGLPNSHVSSFCTRRNIELFSHAEHPTKLSSLGEPPAAVRDVAHRYTSFEVLPALCWMLFEWPFFMGYQICKSTTRKRVSSLKLELAKTMRCRQRSQSP